VLLRLLCGGGHTAPPNSSRSKVRIRVRVRVTVRVRVEVKVKLKVRVSVTVRVRVRVRVKVTVRVRVRVRVRVMARVRVRVKTSFELPCDGVIMLVSVFSNESMREPPRRSPASLLSQSSVTPARCIFTNAPQADMTGSFSASLNACMQRNTPF